MRCACRRTCRRRPIAFGANCGVGPAQLLDSILGLAQGAEPGDVIVSKSNCGLPVMGDDMRVHYDGTPEVMAAYARLARDAGARIIGGCCGTTPAHVARDDRGAGGLRARCRCPPTRTIERRWARCAR